MSVLAEKTCTPCRGGVPPLERDEAEALRMNVKDWQLLDDAHRIERRFDFKDFREALCFVAGVGELAEAERHHPDVSFGWGYAVVSLQTKKIKGLHENDFIMAAKINQLFERMYPAEAKAADIEAQPGMPVCNTGQHPHGSQSRHHPKDHRP